MVEVNMIFASETRVGFEVGGTVKLHCKSKQNVMEFYVKSQYY